MRSDQIEFLHASIMRDMSEGVMVIGLDGVIAYVNPAAGAILGQSPAALQGMRFARCFFAHRENDAFNQCILDAVYDSTVSHRNVVPFFTGTLTRQLHITTSFLKKDEERIGVVAVLSDISELCELRDALKAMERIRELNAQLALRNKLLSETFGRFLSDDIVRELLETPDGLALGGKKRCLTVMMSDLRGFTAMSERMAPQDLIAMLNHYLGAMTQIIQRRNGTIIEFIGDGILAVFGAPLPSPSHAADAVAAAVEMQSSMEEIRAWNAARGYPMLEMGIGVHTGDMIVGNIGSEKRSKYGVVGSHVNLCGRIESYTVGGQILISPATRAMVREPLCIARTFSVSPKGVGAPLLLAEVTGIGGAYALSCAHGDETPLPLPVPQTVTFRLIRDKHNESTEHAGRLRALSTDAALMETNAPLQPFDNLQLEAGGENLFCKVLAAADGGWLLRFTARPPGFARWYAQAASPADTQ